MIKLATAGALLAASAVVLAVPSPASAAPDTTCQKAGIKTLQSLGMLDDVAKSGLKISDAVGYGVSVRDGASLAGVPDPLPLSLILADHRAGSNSLFLYPWC